MEEQRAAMIAILPSEFKDREDALPTRIRADNASVQSKLGRIYALVDEFSAHRAPYVACRQGCSDCCRMNVQISNLEAARIAAATGRRARTLSRGVQHADDKFAGEACPFLIDSSCSIYEHRPYVCRNHSTFDADAYWCDPQRMQTVKLPMLELSGAKQALIEVLKQTKHPLLADIRDFFPAGD
jgi:hypothetical protein